MVVYVGQPRHWNGTECETLALTPTLATLAPQCVDPELPSLSDVKDWLQPLGLLSGREDEETLRRRHTVMSKCTFGEGVSAPARRQFL